jgi:hypothetical protein
VQSPAPKLAKLKEHFHCWWIPPSNATPRTTGLWDRSIFVSLMRLVRRIKKTINALHGLLLRNADLAQRAYCGSRIV